MKDTEGFRGNGLSSHVLAACTGQEKAWEDKQTSRGEFTQALLKTLRAVSADKITFADLIQKIPQLPE